MTDLGALHHFLGISVTRSADGLFLSQRQYAVELHQRAGMAECHSTTTHVVEYRRTGYPERTSKRSLKSHQETKQEGKPWAPHPTRPSPPGPPLRLEPRAGGLGVLTRSPPRARLSTGGLGREHDLRLARGSPRKASAGSPISVSREASFSISLEAGSSMARRPRLG